jgi:hypothetical protein
MSRLDHILLALALAAMALGAAAALAPVRAQSGPVALDRFLSGFERSCNFGPEYQRFVETLMPYDGQTRAYRTTDQAEAPARLRAALGRPELTSDGEITTVTVPLRGTYKGLPVRALRITRGNGVAVTGDGLVFDAPAARVQRALGPVVARAERQRRSREDETAELRINDADGAPQLECYFAF